MTWFKRLTGVDEDSAETVREHLPIEGESLVCPDGRRFAVGRFEMPSLAELRTRVAEVPYIAGRLRLREVVGDVQKLHADKANAGVLFQVASQFNLLEMVGPSVSPERGVGIYESDRTQGPACAIACGAGTIYRNYFVPVDDQLGQSAKHQLDCCADLGMLLGNSNQQLWTMRNGYLLPTDVGLEQITATLRDADEAELDRFRSSLRIGLQWDTEVTIRGVHHRVSQAYCSALPVAYGRQPADAWRDFAKLVLEAAYEATLCAAIIHRSNRLFLTLLGGGAFGNDEAWIGDAMLRALQKYRDHDLDVAVVSYSAPKRVVAKLIQRFGGAD